jgi:hypothetical protein
MPFRPYRRAAIVAAVAIALLAGWKRGAIVDKVLYWRYGQTLGVVRYPAPSNPAQARQQDLDYLARLPSVDRSFGPAAKATFAVQVAALRSRAGELTAAQFFLGVAQAVALADNAHTNVDPASWRMQLDSAPVRFAWFAEGLFVVRATAAHEGLLGAKVLAIDGVDPRLLAREGARYFGGTAEHARAMSPLVLESPEALHALHPGAPDDRLLLDLEDAHGARAAAEVRHVLPAEAPPATKPGRVLLREPLPGEGPGGWKALLASVALAPPSLRGAARSAYATPLDEGRTLYLHLWQIRDDPTGPIAGEIARAMGKPTDPPWQRIVLDLRFDEGGDYPAVREALRRLARRLGPDGRLLILTDDTTFSAAIIAAVLARHFAPGRTTVVGGRPGDRLAFWAEGTPTQLPRSRIRIGVSTGYHDWARGCRELRCYWPNLYYGVAGGNLEPQIAVPWRFADYRNGLDTVLLRALE